MIIRSGDDLALAGTTAAAIPGLAGTVVEDDIVEFHDRDGGASGELQTRVVRVASGTLDFYFAVRSLAGGVLQSVGWNLILTGSLMTDVDFRIDGLGDLGPRRVYRQDFGRMGEVDDVKQLGFWFGTLMPGQSSRFVYVKTDASDYSRYNGLGLMGPVVTSGMSTWSAVVNTFAPGRTTWEP